MSQNSARDGGGVSVSSTGVLICEGCTVERNRASDNGGGVFCLEQGPGDLDDGSPAGCKLVFKDGHLVGNSAKARFTHNF